MEEKRSQILRQKNKMGIRFVFLPQPEMKSKNQTCYCNLKYLDASWDFRWYGVLGSQIRVHLRTSDTGGAMHIQSWPWNSEPALRNQKEPVMFLRAERADIFSVGFGLCHVTPDTVCYMQELDKNLRHSHPSIQLLPVQYTADSSPDHHRRHSQYKESL